MAKKKSKPKRPKQKVESVNTDKHGRRVMVNQDGSWVACKFEFDSQDGRGVVWQYGRSSGHGKTLKKTLLHFEKMGYTIVDWDESV
jgi:hypothetical protein